MSSPTIQATLVGSYPVPQWLIAQPSEQALSDATAVVLHLQELAGIDLAVDGELYRFDPDHPQTNGMIEYFVRPMAGVRSAITRSDIELFRAQPHLGFRRRPAAVVEETIGEGTLDLVAAYERVAALSRLPVKFTLTSPYMLARMLLDTHYKDATALTLALADVLAAQVRHIDAAVIQVDEANLPGRPDDAELAAEAINRILDAVPGTPAVHLCFGNYGGQRIQQGSWAKLVRFFERIHADHVVLELARPGYGDLERLKDVGTKLRFGIGVIDIKTTIVETPEEVAARIATAAGVIGAERIAYVHPDCGFWMLARSIADAKMRALVAGRDLFEGRHVRGTSRAVRTATHA
ncbi:MAG TPA: cobalamin-independent methionine synthase II family protein [Candidatus Dormibacteraeota bacterium]|nr:cobalamin-independent methionine synthase II family protein [Candidatus Dormibacteraeota bacterium]